MLFRDSVIEAVAGVQQLKWGHFERPDGRMMSKAYEHNEARGLYMPETYTTHGHTDTTKRWDDGVRCVLDMPNPAGLQDIYRRHHGTSATEAIFGTGDAEQQIDDVLMPPEFKTSAITFGHDWRGKGLSDHSALWVDFELE